MHRFDVYGTDPKYPKAVKEFSFPGAWNECSVAQLGAIAAITTVAPPQNATPMQLEYHDAHMRLALLRELTGAGSHIFNAIDPVDLIGLRSDELGVDRACFLPELDWCMESPAFHKSILPELMVSKMTYVGPRDQLGGHDVLQWGFCDHLLAALGRSGSAEDLHNLLGALYHPQGTEWNNADIEQRGEALSKLDDRTKLAAVLNYQGLRTWLSKKYHRCFKGGKADPHGVNGMIVRMAGPKFGTVEQTKKANLHHVLIHVEQMLDEQERIEAANRN